MLSVPRPALGSLVTVVGAGAVRGPRPVGSDAGMDAGRACAAAIDAERTVAAVAVMS